MDKVTETKLASDVYQEMFEHITDSTFIEPIILLYNEFIENTFINIDDSCYECEIENVDDEQMAEELLAFMARDYNHEMVQIMDMYTYSFSMRFVGVNQDNPALFILEEMSEYEYEDWLENRNGSPF